MSHPAGALRPRLLLISTEPAPFVDADAAMLARHFEVDRAIGHGAGFVREIVRRARSADVGVSWFASVYTFFLVATMRARRRPSVVILGGVDTARDDRIGYGIWRSRWRRPLLRWTLRRATHIVAVDASLVRALAASSGLDDLPVDVIPTGYDPTYWCPEGPREPRVLAVAGCTTRARALVKGVDLFIDAARRLPDVRFVLAGVDAALAASFDPPSNVTFHPRLDRDRLREEYRRASVFCLPSRHEGLPNALCEAMLTGCIPVAARVGAAVDVVAECGRLVEPGDLDELADAITAMLSIDGDRADELRACARRRIIDRYPPHVRESRLVALVGDLLDA